MDASKDGSNLCLGTSSQFTTFSSQRRSRRSVINKGSSVNSHSSSSPETPVFSLEMNATSFSSSNTSSYSSSPSQRSNLDEKEETHGSSQPQPVISSSSSSDSYEFGHMNPLSSARLTQETAQRFVRTPRCPIIEEKKVCLCLSWQRLLTKNERDGNFMWQMILKTFFCSIFNFFVFTDDVNKKISVFHRHEENISRVWKTKCLGFSDKCFLHRYRINCCWKVCRCHTRRSSCLVLSVGVTKKSSFRTRNLWWEQE